MPVDPAKPRKVLVVHGVQTDTGADQNQHLKVEAALRRRLQGVELAFQTETYSYEDINDRAQAKYKLLIDLFVTNPVGAILAKKALDLVGDVVINLQDGSAAAEIRGKLKKRILEIHGAGNPLYIVAHSLGSVYSFDVINELIAQGNDFFDRSDRRTWPVWGFLTMGSPLGLKMFGRNKVTPFRGLEGEYLRWENFWDPLDPVVSGNIFGAPEPAQRIAELFADPEGNSGWYIDDYQTDSGKQWLMAHTAYWGLGAIADSLKTMMVG